MCYFELLTVIQMFPDGLQLKKSRVKARFSFGNHIYDIYAPSVTFECDVGGRKRAFLCYY